MNTVEKMESARRFPYNTCPASRHAQLLAESMLASTKPRWSIDEPNYCGESIAFVVTWLYQARDRIEALEAENAKLRATCEEVTAKRNMQEQEPVAWHNPVATAVRDESPAPVRDPLHDDIQSVLFEVEQAIENGCCPWQIEAAFEAYEAARRLQQPAHGIGGEK